ncbi:hypothetical protein SERLADRAFT_445376 [Serpula lacrymans var. lacrymans S7.9]|uniref:Uncharacterized protein n=1 Tax=Serpula lacrymans var. lacrymans (strain S7.9) TaxID=578457 RepID=F8NJA8_SERL9|nr:uncharacterized protein SERLADRAFT_445376 [Serpula lacrymans var. lacrymans S7.9]EGO29592.1 hypothetical protein SERLADRAFT_445376 [Serpula lacrymans var. lacrymans S7.9]
MEALYRSVFSCNALPNVDQALDVTLNVPTKIKRRMIVWHEAIALGCVFGMF